MPNSVVLIDPNTNAASRDFVNRFDDLVFLAPGAVYLDVTFVHAPLNAQKDKPAKPNDFVKFRDIKKSGELDYPNHGAAGTVIKYTIEVQYPFESKPRIIDPVLIIQP